MFKIFLFVYVTLVAVKTTLKRISKDPRLASDKQTLSTLVQDSAFVVKVLSSPDKVSVFLSIFKVSNIRKKIKEIKFFEYYPLTSFAILSVLTISVYVACFAKGVL